MAVSEGTMTNVQLPATSIPDSKCGQKAHEVKAPSATALVIGPAFIHTKGFPRACVAAAVCGCVVGLLCIAYVKAINLIPQYWYQAGNSDYPELPSTLNWAAGKPWWIAVAAGAALVQGCIKAATNMDEYPNMFDIIKDREVDVWMGVRIWFLTIVSLIGGASVSPAVGFTAIGSVLGQSTWWIMQRLKVAGGIDPKEMTAAAEAAAIAVVVPSPYLSMLLSYEAGDWPSARQASLMFVCCTASFAVYWSLMPHTYLDASELTVFAFESRANTDYDFAIGMLFGVMGAFLGLIFFGIGTIVKGAFKVLKQGLEALVGQRVRIILLCTLSGVLSGILLYVFPLTLGSGSEMLGPVAHDGTKLNSGLLVASSAAKMISFWCCTAGGLVGSAGFPLLLIGMMMGTVMSDWTGVRRYLAVNCSVAVVGAACYRLPSFWIFVTFVAFNSHYTVLFPIFTAVFTANLLCSGVGIPQFFSKLGAKQPHETDLAGKKESIADGKNSASTSGATAHGLVACV